jgi:hypothetical protein
MAQSSTGRLESIAEPPQQEPLQSPGESIYETKGRTPWSLSTAPKRLDAMARSLKSALNRERNTLPEAIYSVGGGMGYEPTRLTPDVDPEATWEDKNAMMLGTQALMDSVYEGLTPEDRNTKAGSQIIANRLRAVLERLGRGTPAYNEVSALLGKTHPEAFMDPTTVRMSRGYPVSTPPAPAS